MERLFPRDIQALTSIFSFLGEFHRTRGIPDDVCYSINLAVEEIFTNMIKYNIGGRDEISVSVDKLDDEIQLILVDYDVEPFDITKAPEVNTNLPLDKRIPGGLGLHLVKNMMDQVIYEYRDRVSKITLIKRL